MQIIKNSPETPDIIQEYRIALFPWVIFQTFIILISPTPIQKLIASCKVIFLLLRLIIIKCTYINRNNFHVEIVSRNIWQLTFECSRRDCGLQNCPPLPKFVRDRMLHLSLKPLLLQHFVTNSYSLNSKIYSLLFIF